MTTSTSKPVSLFFVATTDLPNQKQKSSLESIIEPSEKNMVPLDVAVAKRV